MRSDDASFELTGVGQLGAWMAYVYARRLGPPVQDAWDLAGLTDGDCFAVQHRPDTGEIAASWHVQAARPASPWPGSDQLALVGVGVRGSGIDTYLYGMPPALPKLAGPWRDVDEVEMTYAMQGGPHVELPGDLWSCGLPIELASGSR